MLPYIPSWRGQTELLWLCHLGWPPHSPPPPFPATSSRWNLMTESNLTRRIQWDVSVVNKDCEDVDDVETDFNPSAPNDVYICRTAQLTSRRCILNIYSADILTEYFKHAAHSSFFFTSRCRLFHNAVFFGSCNIHILNTGCAKILKKIPTPKG